METMLYEKSCGWGTEGHVVLRKLWLGQGRACCMEKNVVGARKACCMKKLWLAQGRACSVKKNCGWGKEGMFCKKTVVESRKACCMKKPWLGQGRHVL